MNKHFVVFGLIAISLFTLVATSPTSVSADWLLDRTGTLIKIDPRILGDDDINEIKIEDQNEVKVEVESSPSSTSKPESDKENKEQQRINEAAKKQAEIARKASDKAKDALERTIKTNELKKAKTNVKKESEIEVEGDKLKIKQKIRDVNGEVVETETQFEKNEVLQIESKTGDETKKFKLRARQDDSVELEKDGVKVGTKLPISINENNELVVTRPDGTTKIVKIMPDQALKMLRDQNITPDDSVTDVNGDSTGLPELEEEDGNSVYKVDGQKEEKVFGLFKVAYKTKAVVSAETGELVRTELSGLDRFMSIFSF
jgi:uncharacterized Rossmann fold enzyme